MLSHDNTPNAFPKSLAQWRASNSTPNLPLIRRRLSQALPSPLTATNVNFRYSTTRNTSRRTIESVANLEETGTGAKQARARMRHIVFVAEWTLPESCDVQNCLQTTPRARFVSIKLGHARHTNTVRDALGPGPTLELSDSNYSTAHFDVS